MSVIPLMPAAYSMDLRLKVLKALERGEKKSHISRTFGISRNTIDLWLKQRDQTGSVAPKSHSRRGPAPKIEDLEAFREFAAAHGHLTQQQMADLWPISISDQAIWQLVTAKAERVSQEVQQEVQSSLETVVAHELEIETQIYIYDPAVREVLLFQDGIVSQTTEAEKMLSLRES